MDRKMRAKRNNAAAKIKRERKASQDLCPDCGDPVSDHASYIAIPVLIDSETGVIEPIPDRSQMN
jgi:hypothetical protein